MVGLVRQRLFFHSFPRPRRGETSDVTLERGLNILAFMKEVGLVLAPEIVNWDVSVISGRPEQLSLLQRRACFTELSAEELAPHSAMFGPIALAFDISKLRGAGATPVIYVPQGASEEPLSQIGAFCVRGSYHTRHVLNCLRELKELSDPVQAARHFGQPVAPDYRLNLQNADAAGNIVADYSVLASDAQSILQHVGFNNIPFDHSAGVLGVFLNMFYPTDNAHAGEDLGYYRQREWRLVAGDINFNGRPMGRSLTAAEIARLNAIDAPFWSRDLTIDGNPRPRSASALVYDPIPGWNFLELVEAVFAPEPALDLVRAIVGDSVAVRPSP